MSDTLTAAVVGGGSGGRLSANALQASDLFELAAITDMRSEVCEELCASYPGIRTFTDLVRSSAGCAPGQLVIVPKYRKRVLYGRIWPRVREIVRNLCRQKGVELLEGHPMPDHVRMYPEKRLPNPSLPEGVDWLAPVLVTGAPRRLPAAAAGTKGSGCREKARATR